MNGRGTTPCRRRTSLGLASGILIEPNGSASLSRPDPCVRRATDAALKHAEVLIPNLGASTKSDVNVADGSQTVTGSCSAEILQTPSA